MADKMLTPRIVAHRGASATRPENTLVALEEARIRRADGIEFDVQLTADDVPVLYHDATLRKVADVDWRIRDCTLAELRAIDFGAWFDTRYAGTPIATLDEVFTRLGRRLDLMVEIKVDAEPRPARRARLVELVLAAIARHGVRRRVKILSFDAGVLRRVQRSDPSLRCVLDVEGPVYWGPVWRKRVAGMHALCLPAKHLDREVVWGVHELDVEAWIYECDTQHDLRRAQQLGVDVVIVDDPGWARELLRTGKGDEARG